MQIPIIRQVPPESVKGKTLFAGTDGKFYNAAGQELKPCVKEPCDVTRCHTRYPFMPYYGSRLCHHLIWETFVGPRTPGMEIDHINGNKLDWSLNNLEEVTPAENRKRAVILRAMRKTAQWDNRPDLLPENRSIEELKNIFNKYEINN